MTIRVRNATVFGTILGPGYDSNRPDDPPSRVGITLETVGYTDEQKARALELLETESVWAAVSEIGCHHTQVYRWHAQHVRTLEKTDESEAAEQLELKALRSRTQRRLLEVAAAHIDRSDSAWGARDAKDYMTAAAIALDKYRLEMGEHTERSSHLSPVDLELGRVIDEFKRQSQASA